MSNEKETVAMADVEIMASTAGDIVQFQLNTKGVGLTGEEMHVVMKLADHYSFVTGQSTVPLGTLMGNCCTEAEVYRALKSLVARGVVTIKRKPGLCNSYTLHLLADRRSIEYPSDHFGEYGECGGACDVCGGNDE